MFHEESVVPSQPCIQHHQNVAPSWMNYIYPSWIYNIIQLEHRQTLLNSTFHSNVYIYHVDENVLVKTSPELSKQNAYLVVVSCRVHQV